MIGCKNILVVDNDTTLVDMFSEQPALCEEFNVTGLESPEEALECAKKAYFDIIIINVDLPNMDSLEACKLLRDIGVRSPIVVLICADTDFDVVSRQTIYATEYVSKPFKLSVLIGRIRVLIGRYERSEDAHFTIGVSMFQPANKLLINESDNKKVRLTDKETAILKYLCRAGGKAVGREVLLNEVWGYNSNITTHTLETHIYRLRQKIELDPTKSKILVTEPRGYKLIM
ncbi:MAG: DNA-binding response regulator [Rhodospirillaceae bacterium TMED8]|nr:DNA-binding response regulator [Magnetovibrio sp.]OUT50366.1 MAG: DNA-binding response regulator [Rhodospirillaceae bacterium TMED8]